MAQKLEKLCNKLTILRRMGASVEDMIPVVESYNGNDWKDYKKFCEKGYQRNRIYIDDHIEVLILCWNSKQTSGVHDHPTNGCILKVLQGSLTEEIWTMTAEKPIKTTEHESAIGTISFQKGK